MSQYTVKHFIRRFEAIPETAWCVDTRHESDGRACALGHTEIAGRETDETKALLKMSLPISPSIYTGGCDIVRVNNSRHGEYDDLGDSPKKRVLAALYSKLRQAASLKDV